LQPKSEKCIFVAYSEDAKGYRLLQPHCNEIIIRRDVKFDENMLSREPNSMMCLLWPTRHLQRLFLLLVSSSDDDSEDENPPPPTHLPPDDSFEPEPTPVPPLRR
jgi:hypothetical protein